MRFPLLTRLAALALALAAPRSADAFCRTTTCNPQLGECTPAGAPGCYTGGVPLYWKSRCVGWSVDQAAGPTVTLDAFEATAATSFATWQAVTCGGAPISIAFTSNGVTTCSEVEFNDPKPNAHILMFRRDAWPHEGSSNTIALTTVTFDLDTGEILDADMELNAADNTFTTADTGVQADLQSIITHEAGHFIGFSHSSVATATMFPAYDKGTTSLRHLDADDVSVACLAYPPERTAPCDATPANGFSALCGSSQANAVGGGLPGTGTSTAPSSSGCGCRVGEGAGSPLGWLVALAALASLRRTRRSP